MSTERRPVRPSNAKETAKLEAAKLERAAARLVIETTDEVLRGVRLRAAQEGVTIRAYVLRLLAKDGVSAADKEVGSGR